MNRSHWDARRFVFYACRLLIGFALIALVIKTYDANAIVSRLGSVHTRWLLLAVLLMYTAALVSSLKWQRILSEYSQRLPLVRLWMLYIEGGFFNLFCPGFVAGDASRVARTSMGGTFFVGALMAVFLERFSGLLAATLFVGGVTFLGGYGDLGSVTQTVIAGSVMAVLLLSALSISKRFVKLSNCLLPGRIGRSFKSLSEKVTSAVEMVLSNPNLLGQLILLSLTFVLLSGPIAYCMAKAIDFHIPLHLLIFYAPLVALLSNLPISVGGLGTREAVSVYFYSALGYLPEDIIALALAQSALLFLINLSGGIILLGSVLRRRTAREK